MRWVGLRAAPLLTILLVVGCSFETGGLPPRETRDAGLTDGAPDGAPDGARDGARDTAPADGPPWDGADAAGDAAPLDGPAGDARGDGAVEAGVELPRSCREILAADPGSRSGSYDIDPAGSGVAVTVHCEMDLDGGGWTLVGRAVAGVVVASFGWNAATGTLSATGAPYSLGPASLSIPFTEVLFARYLNGATPGHHAYKVGVPADFTSACRTTGCAVTSGPTSVLGNCDPPGGPAMLRHLGYLTQATGSFWARDQITGASTDLPFGLFPEGFRLGTNDCEVSGDLAGRAGLIFVR